MKKGQKITEKKEKRGEFRSDNSCPFPFKGSVDGMGVPTRFLPRGKKKKKVQ